MLLIHETIITGNITFVEIKLEIRKKVIFNVKRLLNSETTFQDQYRPIYSVLQQSHNVYTLVAAFIVLSLMPYFRFIRLFRLTSSVSADMKSILASIKSTVLLLPIIQKVISILSYEIQHRNEIQTTYVCNNLKQK